MYKLIVKLYSEEEVCVMWPTSRRAMCGQLVEVHVGEAFLDLHEQLLTSVLVRVESGEGELTHHHPVQDYPP